MTEEEAKTKWCPFARVLVESDEARDHSRIASANRLEVKGAGGSDLGWRAAHCVGPACMAWRPRKFRIVDPDGQKSFDLMSDGVPPAGDVFRAQMTTKEVWVGYCGLAGKPE